METLIVIPARMDSKRFPGKPLATVDGVPLVRKIYDAAFKVGGGFFSSRVVSTADTKIIECCASQRVFFHQSRSDHPTGTHRCAETVVWKDPGGACDVVVNWQVDEPFVEPEWVERLIKVCRGRREIATLTAPRSSSEQITDPNVVKVHINEGRCWHFGREPTCNAQLHCGVYAFPQTILECLADLPPTEQSRKHSLEQLAWLEDGWPIRSVEIPYLPKSINVPEDLKENRNED